MKSTVEHTVLIREMAIGERQEVQRMLLESYWQFKRIFGPEKWPAYAKELVLSVGRSDEGRVFIAEQEGRIVGSIQVFPSSDIAYRDWPLTIDSPIIRFLGVHPDARGGGAARKLLTAAVQHAKECGKKSIFLHTTDTMEKAVKLYEAFGYRREPCYDLAGGDYPIKCYRYDIQNKGEER